MMGKLLSITCLFVLSICYNLSAQDDKQANPEPFSDDGFEVPAEYPQQVDRRRGVIVLDAKQGDYVPGDHFANWHWEPKAFRLGSYYVAINHSSKRTKLGVQVRVGELPAVKGYAPRTARNQPALNVVGKAYITKSMDYPVVLLTGDQSNVADFMVKGMEFVPAAEGELSTQGIDGLIELQASSATTYSTSMHYQPEGKVLTNWQKKKDWAEWNFEVSNPDEFEVVVVQRSNTAGSKVDVLIDGHKLSYTVEPTESDQWKSVSLGVIKLKLEGRHKLAVVPNQIVGDSVMELKQVILKPTN